MKEDSDMSILDTSFHDTLADSRRVPPYRDYHNLQLAALGDRASYFPYYSKSLYTQPSLGSNQSCILP